MNIKNLILPPKGYNYVYPFIFKSKTTLKDFGEFMIGYSYKKSISYGSHIYFILHQNLSQNGAYSEELIQIAKRYNNSYCYSWGIVVKNEPNAKFSLMEILDTEDIEIKHISNLKKIKIL